MHLSKMNQKHRNKYLYFNKIKTNLDKKKFQLGTTFYHCTCVQSTNKKEIKIAFPRKFFSFDRNAKLKRKNEHFAEKQIVFSKKFSFFRTKTSRYNLYASN